MNKKIITNTIIDSLLLKLNQNNSKEAKLATLFINENRDIINGLQISDVQKLFRSSESRTKLSSEYDKIVKSMNFKEKMQFLSQGIQQLELAENNKIKQLVLIDAIIRTSAKALLLIVGLI